MQEGGGGDESEGEDEEEDGSEMLSGIHKHSGGVWATHLESEMFAGPRPAGQPEGDGMLAKDLAKTWRKIQSLAGDGLFLNILRICSYSLLLH